MLRSIWRSIFPTKDKYGHAAPLQTRNDLIWILHKDEWREVCDFCHGNCGQCGLTDRIGNIPASMDAIVKNGDWKSGRHAGLPRS